MVYDVIVDRARSIARLCAALLVFSVGGGMMFVALSSLVWALTFSVGVANVVGAVAGVLFGGLVSWPFVVSFSKYPGKQT
jgi:hypothetical protein